MENLELENKEEKMSLTSLSMAKLDKEQLHKLNPKATKKAKEFVSNETIQLIEDILNDGTVDIKWREQLKAQVRKYKNNGE